MQQRTLNWWQRLVIWIIDTSTSPITWFEGWSSGWRMELYLRWTISDLDQFKRDIRQDELKRRLQPKKNR